MAGHMNPEEMLELFKAIAAGSVGFDEDVWEVTEAWLEDPTYSGRLSEKSA